MPSSPTSVMRLELAERAIRHSGGHPEPRCFLDVGTGEGEFLVRMARRGYSGLSIDVSEEALRRARRTVEAAGVTDVTVRRDDLFTLAGQWPLVLCFEVLEHLDDDVRAIRRLCELVEPGGRLVVTVPARPELWGPSDDLTGHVRRYTRTELEAKLHEAGMTVELMWSVGVPLANALSAVRSRTLTPRRAQDEGEDRGERTRGSSYARSYRLPEGLWAILFNRVTLWPFLLLQRAFVSSPRGAGLIAVARRP